VWLSIIRQTLNLPTTPVGFEGLPAVGKLTIKSPPLLKPFVAMNRRKAYRDQIKPFNFLSTCHVRAFGHPDGTFPERFQLIAPYQRDSRRWRRVPWIDRYSTKTFRITTRGAHGSQDTARVQTYGEVIEAYAFHPESKCADADGRPCGKQTVGLLQRRQMVIGQITPIGKESNSLEEVEAGVIHDETQVYTEYPDRRRDYWQTAVVPALRKIPLKEWERRTGKSRRILIDARLGRRRPHRRHADLLVSVARRLGLL
jgi:hypothetical protein